MELKSRRAKILLGLQKQLETITVPNGYAHSVCKVTTSVHNWHETPAAETPVIYIVDRNTRTVYGAGRTVQRFWTIDLFGVMRDKSQLEMEEFISDIEVCLSKNLTLRYDDVNTAVGHFRVTDIITDGQLFSEIENSQLFKVTVEFIYTQCFDNPR